MSYPSRLAVLYRANDYHVEEAAGCLLVGFKPDSVSFIVKEVWNATPLGEAEAEAMYAELQPVGARYGCRHFRVVAYGGYRADALAFELHGLTVSDKLYVESVASGRHIELFPHNEAAYRAVETGFRTHRFGAVVQATGTGKSFLIARYIVSHADASILVVAPNITILGEIRRAVGRCPAKEISGSSSMQNSEVPGRVIYRTFQALARSRAKEKQLAADHILIDEFHHSGAEVWGEGLRNVIEANPEAKVLGTSATPVRPEGMIDTVDVYFEGNLFYELTLPEAWHYGILPVPLLVQSVYGLGHRLDKLQQALDRSACTSGRRSCIQKKLDAARMDFATSLGASELIRRFLPPSVRKLLVFCRDKADLQQMKPEVMGWLAEAGREATSFEIHTDRSERENERTLQAFRVEDGRLHVLFSINMLIEGLHVEGVDAALFLRRTASYVVTLQQLGRCLKAGSKQQPVILDFVNNLSGKTVYHVLSSELERTPFLRSPRGFEAGGDLQITGFFSDIRRRVSEILAELEPWNIMYERLQEYRSAQDDWPSVLEGKLGLWCNTQRMAKKRGTLVAERIERLDALGFVWEQQDSDWSKNYERLKCFRAREGRWPRRGEGSLSTWCNTQRQARKNGRLAKERIRRLDALDFVWEYDLEKEWQKQFAALELFVRIHHRFPKTAEGSLGRWCVTQRKLHRQGQLVEERAVRLETLGFAWSAENNWMEQFNELLAYYASRRRWPASREGSLGSWCCVQRRLYRKGLLAPERVEKLAKTGFFDETLRPDETLRLDETLYSDKTPSPDETPTSDKAFRSDEV